MMICETFATLTGFSCTPLDEAGQHALIETPFRMTDGDALPIFAREDGRFITFHDDGGAAMHLAARGRNLEDGRQLRPLRTAARDHQLHFGEDLVLRCTAPLAEAPQALARFIGGLLSLAQWEQENQGAHVDMSTLLDEVAEALMRTNPGHEVQRDTVLRGVSQQDHHMDFTVGQRAYVAVRPDSRSSAYAVRRVLDVKNSPALADWRFLAVLDDRAEPDAARREGAVLGTICEVVSMRQLQDHAAQMRAAH